MAKPSSKLLEEKSPEGTVTEPSTVTTVPRGRLRAAPISIGCAWSSATAAAAAAAGAAGAAASARQAARTPVARSSARVGICRETGDMRHLLCLVAMPATQLIGIALYA